MALGALLAMALHVSLLQAQTLVGTWQGTLPVDQNARIVVKLTKDPSGSLRGLFSWFDQNSSGWPFTSVTLTGRQVKLDSTPADVSFHGNLNDDGKSMQGTWTQTGKTFPLTLTRAEGDAVWSDQKLHPMVAADPAFEVATVKPTAPGTTGSSIKTQRRQFAAKNRTVEALIRWAYQLQNRQIEGGPKWMEEDHFDIAAEPDAPGQPDFDQSRTMMQKLLVDRFGLRFHTVEKEFPVYRVVVAKTPVKMKPNDGGMERQGNIIIKQVDDNMLLQWVGMSMPEFSNILMNFITDRQVVDATGLHGRYDFVMTVPISALDGGVPGSDSDPYPSFFAAVQQLGLKLEPGRESLKVMVIDRLQKPSAN